MQIYKGEKKWQRKSNSVQAASGYVYADAGLNYANTDTNWTNLSGSAIREYGFVGKRLNGAGGPIVFCTELGVPVNMGNNPGYNIVTADGTVWV